MIKFFVLHQVVGYRPSTFSWKPPSKAETAVKGSRSHLAYSRLLNLLLFGPLSPYLIKGLRRSPFLIRRSAMLPAYFGLLLVVGYWREIRYWISLLPIVVPTLIAAFPGVTPSWEADGLSSAA